MGDFFRSAYGVDNEQGFVQGAGRILVAPYSTVWPDGLEDILVLPAGSTQYDVVTGWKDVGFTKTGINITRTNAEDEYTVDQVNGPIRRRPNNWEMSIGTQLAEGTLETFVQAWELDAPTTVTKTSPQLLEKHVGLGAPTSYKSQRVAVVFLFPDGIIRAWVFRRCEHSAQETGFTLNSTGDQVSLPQRWNALADATAPKGSVFGEMFEQIPV